MSQPTTPQVSTAPTCYRHPDRETYIRCVRCDRPICPDCMIPASVGFQCPECVREGSAGVRQARTTFGGRLSQDPGYVSKLLIGLCVLAYLAQQVLGPAFTSRFLIVGLARSGVDPVGIAAGEWYRLVSAAFLHGSVFHLLFNLYALYLFGPSLEAKLGRARFTALYLVSALGGSAASYVFSPAGQRSLGASGAIFGLFGAWIVVSRRLGRDASQLYVLLGLNLVLAFVIPNIDWKAHLGGLAAGAAVAGVFAYAPRARRTLVQALGVGAVLALCLGAVVVHTGELTDRSAARVATCITVAPADPTQTFVSCVLRDP